MLRVLYLNASTNDEFDTYQSLISNAADYHLHLCDQRKSLAREAAQVNPDLIVVSCRQLTNALAQQCQQVYEQHRFALLMLCAQGDCPAAQRAIDAGVTTFITGTITAERLPTIVATTLARHKREHQLSQALGSAQQKLSDRAVIEQAKGLVMQNRQLSESDAYKLLRKQAMQRQQKLVELARQLVELNSL